MAHTCNFHTPRPGQKDPSFGLTWATQCNPSVGAGGGEGKIGTPAHSIKIKQMSGGYTHFRQLMKQAKRVGYKLNLAFMTSKGTIMLKVLYSSLYTCKHKPYLLCRMSSKQMVL